jgi:hypothetical protein
MSTAEFEKLFTDYPVGGETEALKHEFHIALAQNRFSLSQASRALELTTVNDQTQFYNALSNTEWVLLNGYNHALPSAFVNMMSVVKVTFSKIVQGYNVAITTRRGFLWRKGNLTQEEFTEIKNATQEVIQQLEDCHMKFFPDC